MGVRHRLQRAYLLRNGNGKIKREAVENKGRAGVNEKRQGDGNKGKEIIK